jgi:predicted acetyltransferase
MNEEMKLILPSAEWADEIKDFRREFLETESSMDGQGLLPRMDDPLKWITWSRAQEKRETCSPDLVPATQFLYVNDEVHHLAGMIQVRHEFNDFLAKYGGHIGYSIRPCDRRKGYGTAQLQAVLPYCWSIGLNEVLITCLRGNTGSEKIILACGGVYESTVTLHDEKQGDLFLKRFWIRRP